MIVTVAQRKGGCGKTTIAASLVAAAVYENIKNVSVDLDSQATFTRWALGTDPALELLEDETAAALVFPPSFSSMKTPRPPDGKAWNPREYFDSVAPRCFIETHRPGHTHAGAAYRFHPEHHERLLLEFVPAPLVIVDCAPDISQPLTRSALSQTEFVFAPVVLEPWVMGSCEYLIHELHTLNRADLIHEKRIRFVVNMRARSKLQDQLERDLKKRFPGMVSKTSLARSVAVAECTREPNLLTEKTALFKCGLALLNEMAKQLNRLTKAAA